MGELQFCGDKDINLTILNYSKFHIDVCVMEEGSRNVKCFVTGVYGHLDSSLKYRA